MLRFPLPETARYSYEQRFSTGRNGHLGTDIFAPAGTPVLAVEAGIARSSVEPKGGNVVYLEVPGGAFPKRYFYAHLQAVSPILLVGNGVRVEAGDEIGWVGDTGNAKGKPPHLHFQLRHGSLNEDPFQHLLDVDPQNAGVSNRSVAGIAIVAILALLLMRSRS